MSFIYWWGHRKDWQGQWLRARTTAELTWYLPMLAPLLSLNERDAEPNWYVRTFDPGHHLRTADDVAVLCARIAPLTTQHLTGAWADRTFIASYVEWALGILEQQRLYHQGVAVKQQALLHRVHKINGSLFALTAVGALLHLILHTLWLSLVTTFFPALGASYHGALAQSEAYRLSTTSQRLSRDLEDAQDRIRAAAATAQAGSEVMPLKIALESALVLILEEHQDWNLLVRPHHLPLA